MKVCLLALILIAVAVPVLADCPLDLGRGTGIVVFSERFIVALRPEPLPVEVGQPFALILNVCTKNNEPAELAGIDAQLDEKNVITEVPRIVAGKDGRYRAENIVVTAPGSWEVGFNVRRDGDVERLTYDLVVK